LLSILLPNFPTTFAVRRIEVVKVAVGSAEGEFMASVSSPSLSTSSVSSASEASPKGSPDSGRSDDQKQCRKIVIRTGLRLAQKSGLLLTAGVVLGIVGFKFKGSTTVAMLGFGLLLVLAALPLISIGKSLSRMNSPMLAAIDEPSLVSAMHVAAKPRGGRLTLAVRFLDDRIVQMAIKPEELAVLRAYYNHARDDLRIQASENPTRTIRPIVAIA
jgi:hypothetical protein